MLSFFHRCRIYYIPTIEEDIHRYCEFILSMRSNVVTENNEQPTDAVGFTCATDIDQDTGINSLVEDNEIFEFNLERMRMILAYRYE